MLPKETPKTGECQSLHFSSVFFFFYEPPYSSKALDQAALISQFCHWQHNSDSVLSLTQVTFIFYLVIHFKNIYKNTEVTHI